MIASEATVALYADYVDAREALERADDTIAYESAYALYRKRADAMIEAKIAKRFELTNAFVASVDRVITHRRSMRKKAKTMERRFSRLMAAFAA